MFLNIERDCSGKSTQVHDVDKINIDMTLKIGTFDSLCIQLNLIEQKTKQKQKHKNKNKNKNIKTKTKTKQKNV